MPIPGVLEGTIDEELRKRVYVAVVAEHDPYGKVTPREIHWASGRRYEIDRVLDVRRAASLRAGGQGTRYTVRIAGKETFLFDEDGRWFVEAK